MTERRVKYPLLFSVIVVIICLFPIYGNIIDHDMQLKGVTVPEEEVPTDFHSFWTGIAQDALESKLVSYVPGRKSLIRLHSQLLYSLFNSSSNSNIVIGSKHSLYEPEYLCDFLNLWPEMSEDAHNDLISKLNQLQSLLTQKRKKLYIVITPSKVRYDYSNIPLTYRMLTKPKLRTNYDRFIYKLKNTSINYFDSIEYINENMNGDNIFYSSGIHWGNGAAAQVTTAILEDMKKDTGYDLGNMTINMTESENGQEPDQDLLSILNLFFYSKEDTYQIPEYSYIPGTDHPNVLLRGGSFMGQSLNKLIDLDVFNQSIYFQNNLVINNKSDVQVLSDFNSYEEIDVQKMTDMADLVILEVNEEKIWTMGWGFIDELISTLQKTDEELIQMIGQRSLSTDINPWGTNIGYIDYKDKESIIITSPFDAKLQFNIPNNANTISFDAEIHDWVRQYSDGCVLCVKLNGEETTETEYNILGGDREDSIIHITVPVEGIHQVSITYYNPEGTTPDCDWVVISNINIE